MNDNELDFMAALLKQHSGLIVSKDKVYLLENRLAPIARLHGFSGLGPLIEALRGKPAGGLVEDVVEAMTTNESFFFRDGKPFDLFRDKVLPDLIAKRAATKTIRIWCAAASTGQEPYTLAMILKEKAAQLAGWKIQILGTDISRKALDRAKSGIYSQFEVQRGLPVQMLVKYFEKQGDVWQVKPDIRSMVDYRLYNLLHDLKPLGQFDIVFCRNVLIYFDLPTKERVLDGISKVMTPDGLLFLGGAETVFGVSNLFKPQEGVHGLYCRTTPGAPAASPIAAPAAAPLKPIAPLRPLAAGARGN
ncbi:MAG TPA: protein-glutamate O-methyltransferase CheR [Alphaproteobacteria bacterium]|nr:protein-glutamate O-methyltransferase CheR [Alphaproteobacteria bacterium]